MIVQRLVVISKICGRKRLDPAKTRDTILAAALDAFAERGFDGTSIAEIAARAHVPNSLLQYHFGTKEELWKACFDQKAAPLLEPLDRFLVNPDAETMTQLVIARFRLFQENPPVARMLAWMSLGSAPLPEMVAHRRELLLRIGTSQPSTPDLTRLLFALSAMDGWFSYRNLYQCVFGDTVGQDALGDEFLQFLLEALRGQTPERPLTEK